MTYAPNLAPEGIETVTIVSPNGLNSASFVPKFGGSGYSIVLPGPDGPRETMYLHDFFWDEDTPRTRGGWPFLFPICGRLERDGSPNTYLYRGRRYEMPSHGFGMRMPWAHELSADKTEVRLTLRDTQETFVQYPFSFEVVLTYTMTDEKMTCHQSFTNKGPFPMPFYAGFHPYFVTPPVGPEGKEQTLVMHEPYRRYVYNESLTDLVAEDELPAFPQPCHSPLLKELLSRVLPSNELTIQDPEDWTIHMTAKGIEDPDLYKYVQHYTMEDKAFFCVEPWMSHPNALNAVDACPLLPPDETVTAQLELWTTFMES